MDLSRVKNSIYFFTLFGLFVGYAAAKFTSLDNFFDDPLRYFKYTVSGGGLGLVVGLAVGLSKWAKFVVKSDDEI